MLLNELMPWRTTGGGKQKESSEYPMMRLHEEVDRIFENFFKEFPSTTTGFGKDLRSEFVPRVNVIEKEKEIRVEIELPGMEEKDLELSIDNGFLVISGEKKHEREDKKDNYYMMERSYGSFCRQLPLPAEADQEHIKAEFKSGVLNITIMKTEEARSKVKKIPISAE